MSLITPSAQKPQWMSNGCLVSVKFGAGPNTRPHFCEGMVISFDVALQTAFVKIFASDPVAQKLQIAGCETQLPFERLVPYSISTSPFPLFSQTIGSPLYDVPSPVTPSSPRRPQLIIFNSLSKLMFGESDGDSSIVLSPSVGSWNSLGTNLRSLGNSVSSKVSRLGSFIFPNLSHQNSNVSTVRYTNRTSPPVTNSSNVIPDFLDIEVAIPTKTYETIDSSDITPSFLGDLDIIYCDSDRDAPTPQSLNSYSGFRPPLFVIEEALPPTEEAPYRVGEAVWVQMANSWAPAKVVEVNSGGNYRVMLDDSVRALNRERNVWASHVRKMEE